MEVKDWVPVVLPLEGEPQVHIASTHNSISPL